MNTAIIAFTLLAAYIVTACIINRSIPDSISQMVNSLPSSGMWLWSAVMLITAALTMPAALAAASDNTRFLAFLSCISIVFMALTPLVSQTITMAYHVHMATAIISAVTSQLLVAANCLWLMLGWLPFIVSWYLFSRKNQKFQWKFWAETTCFILTFAFCLT